MTGKPLGIGIKLSDGIPCYYATPINRIVDQIWDAVREAINANMTPDQFKREVAEAWASHLREDAKYAQQELLR